MEERSKNERLWPLLVSVIVMITAAVVIVLSGSKRTMNADDIRHHVDKVAFTAPARMAEGSVFCPRDHTHGYPVCAACKKIMQPLANGLFICPECGQIGLPICPECGELMQSERMSKQPGTP
ncbi:MAG: hypothetical protein HQM15_08370 [Deltaproteobacteria bacterium]|nr:hypothetical protein [Deltaproteobacteria bacterium]